MTAIRIRPRDLTLALSSVVALFGIAHVTVVVLQFRLGRSYFFLDFFNLDLEGNLPAFYSACALLLCAIVLAAIAIATRRRGEGLSGYWILLALLFFFLAVDEAIQIHERFSGLIRRHFEVNPWFQAAWIIPYGLALLVLVGFLTRFLRRLPRVTLYWFLAAGTLFVAGAIGVESLSGLQYIEDDESYSQTYYWIILFEEMLEMIGVIVLLHGLLRYCETHLRGVALAVGPSEDTP